MGKDWERTRKKGRETKETGAVTKAGGDGSLDLDLNSEVGEVKTKDEIFRR